MSIRQFATLALLSLLLLPPAPSVEAATISGQLIKWHPVTVDFQGPRASETDEPINPFLDYRLTVEFTSPSGQVTQVPGFFAGNGQGGGQGNVWRARFSPDEAGRWSYRGLLQSGEEIAVNLDLQAGNAVNLPDAAGQFDVAMLNSSAPGFLRYGRLEYVGQHYLKFRDGPYWIKGGTDSPENLLGFAGFDGTTDQGGINPDFLHQYDEHRADFREGDPEFRNEATGVDSRGLIGALNYLGEQGVNSVYFLPMNLGGDGQETYPFVGAANNRFDKTHYDISKLYQWNLVLNHAQEQGIALNVVLSETETANERWLDNGALGVERRLFFRELIARFGYLLAVKWNLGEENDFRLEQLQRHADYIQALDWTRKPIAVHTHINQFYRYGEIVGDPRFTASSIQYDQQFAGQFVEEWRARSTNAGRPWILDMDENTNGLGPDDAVTRRKQILYDVLFSGGNIEWYFGYQPLPVGGDIDAGNFRYREPMWRSMRLARELMQREMPFWQMRPADNLVQGESDRFGGAEVFALDGEYYAVYLPASNGQETITLAGTQGGTPVRFRHRWFDPETGFIYPGSTDLISGAGQRLGTPPSRSGEDWVALIDRLDSAPAPSPEPPATPMPDPEPAPVPPVDSTSGPSGEPGNNPVSNTAPSFPNLPVLRGFTGELFTASLIATDSDGTFPVVTVGRLPAGMRVQGLGNGQLQLRWQVPMIEPTQVIVELIAVDAIDPSLVTRQNLVIDIVRPQPQPQSQPQQPEPEQTTPFVSGPRFIDVPSPTVSRGEQVQLTLRAIDDGIYAPVVTVGNVPAGMRVEGPGDGRLLISWNVPDTANVRSVVELITFNALDPSIRRQQQMIITVRDSAESGSGNGTTAGNAQAGRNAPVFRRVADAQVRVGDEISFTVIADDVDGVPPSIVLTNSPPSATFQDNGNGGRIFRWRPSDADVGRNMLRFIASDSTSPQLTDQMQVSIEVVNR